MNYAEHRPINELWLTTIPKHWDNRKIKYAFSERVEKGFPDEQLLVASQNMGVVPKGVYGSRTVEATKDLHKLKLVRVGDFVISLRSFQGGLEYAYYQGIISPAYTIIIPNELITGGYFRFLAKSRLFIELLQMCVTGIREGQNIDYSKLKNHTIPFPPLPEQDQIVCYLDWKVSGINKLINAKKKQIALLQEQKRAVVNEAVTKDGEGWEKKSLKYWVKSNISSLGANVDPNLEFDYLDISSVGHGYMKQKPVRYAFDSAPSRARRIVQYGDTIISTVRTYLKSVCFIDCEHKNCIVSTGFSVLTPDKNTVVPELLSFVLSSDEFIDDVIRNSIGVSYPAINDSSLMTLKVALPISLEEQQAIYEKMKRDFSIFDRIIEKINTEIILLGEYRTRLISDVVTGKMDVREVAVPQYEAVEVVVDSDIEENEAEETEEE